MKYQCLMIDDEQMIAETTSEYFNMFDIKTAFVTNYDDALSFLEVNEVSMILLDINLGSKSGFELCKKIRQKYNMPILFISARTSDDDILTALNIGGDDYIKKPYTLSILLAKAKAVINRYEGQSKLAVANDNDKLIMVSENIMLDTDSHRIIKDDDKIMLKAMEYKLLQYLLNNKNKVITKEELFQNVWEDAFVGDGTLNVHIRHLREKIEIDPNKPEIIKTVWGVGYIIEEFEE